MELQALASAIPPDVNFLCERLRDRGYRAWVVGGCVRDLLLTRADDPGEVRNDWDIATDAHPEQVTKTFRKVLPTGIQHGTVTVMLKRVGYEVTTLRGETTYTDGRRPDSVFFVDDIAADLARRDFTVNAIAYDPLCQRLIDPFGGQLDLAARRLRAVGVAAERFAEDGLRVLRAARFVATLEMGLDAETAEAIRPSLDSYRQVSPERIRDEWMKAMKARRPSRAFEVMRAHGMLELTCPELARCEGVAADPRHELSVFDHLLRCVDLCPPDPILRHAALFHDIGEPEAGVDAPPERHAQLGAELARKVATRLRFSKAETTRMTSLIRHHAVRPEDLTADSSLRRFMRRAGADTLADIFLLKQADVLAQCHDEPGASQRTQLDSLRELQARSRENANAALETKQLAIGGRDLIAELGAKPGPGLGEVLEALLEQVLDDPALNERAQLLERARGLLAARAPK